MARRDAPAVQVNNTQPSDQNRAMREAMDQIKKISSNSHIAGEATEEEAKRLRSLYRDLGRVCTNFSSVYRRMRWR